MYVINGALASPYSIKMRSVFRYRRLPHIWQHGAATHAAAVARVKAPVIPVVEFPDGSAHNDSTPLIERLEERHAERSIVPADPGRAFLAFLLEDFGDEWLTKAMFGYRWLFEADQVQMSRWLAFDAMKGGRLENSLAYADQFRERQIGRVGLVGCTHGNFRLIEASTRAVLAALEAHVVDRHCLFGTRPSLAEFAIQGQLSQLAVDPTPQAMMRADFPYTYRWLFHVDDMSGIEGEWDAPGTPLAPVVEALLKVAGEVYLPFLLANHAALEAGREDFGYSAMGFDYSQPVFRYQARCLASLRDRFAALHPQDRAAIEPLLDRTGCLAALAV